MRLIDADALFDDLIFPSKQFERGLRELIGDSPTIDAVPVVHGRWEPYSVRDCLYICSECNCIPRGKTRYCPNCGAKMNL